MQHLALNISVPLSICVPFLSLFIICALMQLLLQFVRFFCHFNLIMLAILTCLVNCNVEDIECSVLAKIWKSTGTGKARSLCMFILIQLLIITWGLIMARQWNYMYHKYLAKVYLFIHCSCIRAHIMKRLKKGTQMLRGTLILRARCCIYQFLS
jgi:hypothetical protein